jgi:hypothetical protein
MKIPAAGTVILMSRFHGQMDAHSKCKRFDFIGMITSAADMWAVPMPAAEQVLGAQSGLFPDFCLSQVPPDGPVGFLIFLVC